MKMYNVVVVNNKTGVKVVINDSPLTHSEGCAMLAKLTKYAWRTEKLEQIG
ncbi:hypothetical protein [Escherichia phage pO91]|uniref:Uncharacterized protein n=1 Tax=Escherichia phage pO91 TaxID=3072194 RepID=A0AA51N1R5_9CAUD|nr:hypothetical protein [Escherichia phage pO91]